MLQWEVQECVVLLARRASSFRPHHGLATPFDLQASPECIVILVVYMVVLLSRHNSKGTGVYMFVQLDMVGVDCGHPIVRDANLARLNG